MIFYIMVYPWGLHYRSPAVVFCRWALHDLSIHGTSMGTPVISSDLFLLPVLLSQIHVGAR